MVRASIADSRHWLALKLVLVEEVIDRVSTEEELEESDKIVTEWEQYEFPEGEVEIIDRTCETLADTFKTVNSLIEILGEYGDFARKILEKNPNDPDAKEILEKLKK